MFPLFLDQSLFGAIDRFAALELVSEATMHGRSSGAVSGFLSDGEYYPGYSADESDRSSVSDGSDKTLDEYDLSEEFFRPAVIRKETVDDYTDMQTDVDEKEDEPERGRSKWPRLLWCSDVSTDAKAVIEEYYRRTTGGPIEPLDPHGPDDEIGRWSRKLDAVGL